MADVDDTEYVGRRGRRNMDMDDDEDSSRSRRSRRGGDEDDEDYSRSRRGRRQVDEDEEEDEGRRSRRGRGRDDDDEDTGSHSRSAPRKPGGTLGSMPESRRRKIQQAVLDGMFKFAEQKYGRKRSAPAQKKRDIMGEYDIYLRSLKAKCKTADDKVAAVLKQKRDIDDKYKKAETEAEKHHKVLQDAEDEKERAVQEGRDPKLPEGFVAPAAATKKGGFANLVMKASAQLWEEKFNAMRAKKGSDDQPAWMKEKAGGRRSEKVLLNVGKARQKKGEKHEEPKWASKTGLKKTERGRGGEHDDAKPAFSVQLRKTKKEDKEEPEKKIDWRSRVKKRGEKKEEENEQEPEPEEEEEEAPAVSRSRRRRGGDDSD